MSVSVGQSSLSTNINNGLVKAVFNGRNGSGAVSLPGLLVGDVLIYMWDGSGFIGSQFERIVSVADELQQNSASDLSAISYTAVFARGF